MVLQSMQTIIVWDYGVEGLHVHSEVLDLCLSRSLIVVSQEELSPNQGRQRCWRLVSYKLKRLDIQDRKPYEF